MPVAAHVPHRHAPRRVLVTGAAGTLGRAVVRDLAATGVDVVAVDRRPPAARPDDGHGRVVSVDVRDARQVREVMAECDGVVHLAAHPGPGAVPDEELFSNNTLATFTVISAAAGHGIRSVAIASSICIYGMTYAARPFSPEHVPIDEDSPLVPQDAYGLSKLVDEQTAQMFVRAHEMDVTALRFHWVASHQEARTRASQLNDDAEQSVGELWSYIDLRDAARACRLALRSGNGFHAVNIAATDTLSRTPTAELVERFHPSTERRRDIAGTDTPWSIDRAREVIGFTPRWSWRSEQPQEVATG